MYVRVIDASVGTDLIVVGEINCEIVSFVTTVLVLPVAIVLASLLDYLR